MIINRQSIGLKGQLILAQGNPEASGVALGWRMGIKIVRATTLPCPSLRAGRGGVSKMRRGGSIVRAITFIKEKILFRTRETVLCFPETISDNSPGIPGPAVRRECFALFIESARTVFLLHPLPWAEINWPFRPKKQHANLCIKNRRAGRGKHTAGMLGRILAILCLLFLNSCSKDDLIDLVIGSQPTFIDSHQFTAGLNIFGVIRPDSVDGKPMNALHIEKVIPAVSSTDDSTTVVDYSAAIYKTVNNRLIDSLCFTYKYPDTIYTHLPTDFNPLPGNRFQIVCKSPGLPTLTAETIIPNQPAIVDNSISTTGNKVQFSIQADATAYLYDVYLFVGRTQYTQRILRATAGDTHITIDANLSGDIPNRVVIYAYDKNLSEYLTAPNLFIKPNTYRPPFSSVRNGYGCFGSLNLLSKLLPSAHR
jgi:hypothetical protein